MKVIKEGKRQIPQTLGQRYAGRHWIGEHECNSVVELEQSDFNDIQDRIKESMSMQPSGDGRFQYVQTVKAPGVMCPLCRKRHSFRLLP